MDLFKEFKTARVNVHEVINLLDSLNVMSDHEHTAEEIAYAKYSTHCDEEKSHSGWALTLRLVMLVARSLNGVLQCTVDYTGHVLDAQ